MLRQPLGWCGKVPLFPDYIQSEHFIDVQKSLMEWLMRGQDHIGEQFIKSESRFTIYYFFLESSISDHKRIHGLFISSHDSRGRSCPFLIFSHDPYLQPVDSFGLFQKQLNQLGLKWQDFFEKLEDDFYGKMQEILKSLDIAVMFEGDADRWIEIYPETFKSNFKIEATNHLIYRKLLIR